MVRVEFYQVALTENRWLIRLRDYALIAATILVGIVLLPIMIPLYLIPSVREPFDQLAYEYAMRGRTERRRQSCEGDQEEGGEGVANISVNQWV